MIEEPRLLDRLRDRIVFAGSDHSNKLFFIKEHSISNGFQVLWGCFQARNIGHNHSSVRGA